MKKTIYILAIVLAFAGCTDELKKADYDYIPNPANLPAITIAIDQNSITGSSAGMSAQITFGNDPAFIEKGFVLSKTADFADFLAVTPDAQHAPVLKATADKLDDETQYHVKGYVLTKDGIAYSAPLTFTTLFIPPQWEAIEGEWTVTEDFNLDGEWNNDQTYKITITGVAGDKRKIKIEGFAPYKHEAGHTIYATVDNMKLTLPSQELLPEWEPGFKTHFAALKSATFKDNMGRAFSDVPITKNSDGSLEIKLLGGMNSFGFQIYDTELEDGAFAGGWGYTDNTKWVK
ncbi:MAG: hypothetical protein LBG31_01285 [Prevotellaceae bacterium]|jgi:hypothetical protein|nr:hypothetical protein [Prevotellaceae bacterium]